jgi:hypothetical protein
VKRESTLARQEVIKKKYPQHIGRLGRKLVTDIHIKEANSPPNKPMKKRQSAL